MSPPLRICIVGAGPRGTGVLERLCALGRDRRPLVHVVDPFPAGPGRIWRRAQPDLLWMNSPLSTVDMFGGPAGQPSLWDWSRGDGAVALAGTALAGEASRLDGRRFASRPLAGAYYEWVFARAAAGPVTVRVHRDRAVDVRDHGREQAVWLAGSPEPLIVDVIILAQGHLGTRPTADERALTDHAGTHGLTYRPPGHADEVPVSELRPGQPVLLRGLGLTFIDQVTLLTQGRGGKFRRTVTDRLVYEPSGEEPMLYGGSRRGVPYHAKPASSLLAGPPPSARFYSREAVASLGGSLDFRQQLWPLVVKEILAGYYHELLLGHPDRATMGWQEFSRRLGCDATDELVAAAVPDPADRFDLAELADPMAGLRFGGRPALQAWMRDYVVTDIGRRSDTRHTAELGALAGLGSAVMTTLEMAGHLEPGSYRRDVERWFLPFASFLSSGPPARRLEELVALSEAGIVRFLGSALQVTTEEGAFVATGAVVPGAVRATGLIETRLAEPAMSTTTDPLLAALFSRGECREDELTGRLAVRRSDHRLVDSTDIAHPSRFAAGPGVADIPAPSAPDVPEFGFFAVNDALARAVLRNGEVS
jgi:uncharacterized NAD(P)/FAD-binding protein YdhS